MKGTTWTTVGSVLSAAASSACCWLPLLSIATGTGIAGGAVFLERFRWPLLILAGGLLAAGFALAYRPGSRTCAADGSCPESRSRPGRARRAMLWFSAIFVVGFALFPDYAGGLLGKDTTRPASASSGRAERLVLSIDGMTCAGCEEAVERALVSLPGVVRVAASHEDGRAVIETSPGKAPTRSAMAEAIAEAGYRVAAVLEEDPLSGHWTAEATDPDGEFVRIVMDLGRMGPRWVGEFDLPDYEVADYPIEVLCAATDSVSLYLTAIDVSFEGRIGENGSLTGVFADDLEVAVTFTRTGPPELSEGLLDLEETTGSRAVPLSGSGAELRERFNADRDKTRLLTLLSPT